MHPIKSSIKRLLLALGLSQKTITHLGFAYARGKRNVSIVRFVVGRILVGGGQPTKDSALSGGDSALRDKSPILRGGLAHYRLDKSLRPPLKSGDLSSQILESQSEIRKQLDPTASDSTLESTFTQSPDSISKILPRETMGEKKADSSKSKPQADPLSSRADTAQFPSSRASETSVAIHSLESIFSNVNSMDCHATASAVSRNDKNLDSNNNAQKCLESTFENTHAQYDSKHCGGALQALGQFGGGSYLSGNDYPQIAPILSNRSPKTESPQAQKPTPQTPPVLVSLTSFPGGSYLSGNDYPQIAPILSNRSPKTESPQAQKPTPQTPPVLVSLTSFPARLPYLHHTLYSLLTQDYKDFHIALFLSSSEIAPSKLPLILKIFKKLGLLSIHFVEENLRAYKKLFYALQAYPEHIIITIDDDQIYAPNTIQKLGLLSIHFVEENLRAYKKLFYALQAYPEHIIITIDDDQIYAPNTIRLLLESYARFPRAIHTHLAYDGAYMADILQVDCATYCAIIKESSPHLALASVGVSGVLYPPRAFSQEFFNTQAILSLAPYSDDLWFFVMSVLNDMPKVLIQGALEHPKESSIAQDESPNLWEINCEQHRNYDQLRALLEAYPQARAKILESLGLCYNATNHKEQENLWEINCEQHRNYDQLRALLEAYPQARAKILESLGLCYNATNHKEQE